MQCLDASSFIIIHISVCSVFFHCWRWMKGDDLFVWMVVSIEWGCVWMRSGYWCYSFIGLRLRSNQQVRRGYETDGSEPSWSYSPLSYITITTKEIHFYIHEYCTVPFDRNKKINSLNINLFDKIKQPKIVAESIIDAHNIQLQSYKVKVEKWSSASANFFLQKRTIKLMWIF